MERVWYFAYGSNMQTATFAGRRGVTPSAARAARVRGWRLVVDKPPLVGTTHSFVNIVPDSDAEVFGVAYEITADDMAHIELTEGVSLGNYRRVAIDVIPLEAPHAPRAALTLVSDRRAETLRPSAHYMALLIEGAETHGLPSEWIAFLRALPTAADTPEAATARTQVDRALARLRR